MPSQRLRAPLLISALSIPFAALLFSQAASAASLGLTATYPDLTTPGADLDYTFTAYCLGDDGGATSGICGTDNGQNGNNKVTYDGALDTALSGGLLTITKVGNLNLTTDGSDLHILTGGDYNLTANFDGTGTFTGGTLLTTYAGIVTLNPGSGNDVSGMTGGTALSGDLTASGFDGVDAVGILDFTFLNAGGDILGILPTIDPLGGVIANITTLAGVSGAWDPNMDFQSSFSATGVNVDTFVPVPAAVWLMGSGLLSLFGFKLRRRAVT